MKAAQAAGQRKRGAVRVDHQIIVHPYSSCLAGIHGYLLESAAMDRDVENRRIIVKDILHAVPVVHIPAIVFEE